jgi:hypothetical protein
MGTINWRPTFSYYNRWIALSGGLACLFCMIIVNALASAIAFILAVLTYRVI